MTGTVEQGDFNQVTSSEETHLKGYTSDFSIALIITNTDVTVICTTVIGIWFAKLVEGK